jgi:hypothetical protein
VSTPDPGIAPKGGKMPHPSRVLNSLLAPILGVAAAVGATVLPGTAHATDNTKLAGEYHFVDTLDCADPVVVHSIYDEMAHTYIGPDGMPVAKRYTGKVAIQCTDLTNGRTFRPNSSGPGLDVLATGVSIVRGANGAVFIGDGLFATNGPLLYDADGNLVSWPHHMVSVCAALGTVPAP